MTGPTLITINANIKPGVYPLFLDWQAKLNKEATSAKGFVSLEFLSPNQEQNEQLTILRFDSIENALLWKNSPLNRSLIDKLQEICVENGLLESVKNEISIKTGATEIIFTEINQEQVEAYLEWSARIHQLEAKFPGFKGVYLQPPAQNNGRHWITLLHFDSIENLDNWLGSNERRKFIQESGSFISSFERHRIISPFSGWFVSVAKNGILPAAWKQAMVVLLVLFPIVMFLMKYVSPLTKGLNTSLATFISNVISVSLLTYIAMPLAVRVLDWWLTPTRAGKKGLLFIGTALILALYLTEIFLLWHFN